ncbi:MAG: glycosyltransferase, partial [Methylomonas sp.]
RRGRRFSTVSDYMTGQIQHYTSVPIKVVPNPLADYVLSSGSRRGLAEHKRIAMICNGWEARKNPKPALHAFAEFRTAYPEAELHLFGHGFGPGESGQAWCLQRNIAANMHFHGPLAHKKLIARLNELDLLLHPALEESFGVVIAEAMALGLPLVAGKNSGAAPWVIGYAENTSGVCCGVLTDVSQPQALAAAMAEAFDARYPERSAAGFTRARQMFTPNAACSAYMDLYREVLGDAGH